QAVHRLGVHGLDLAAPLEARQELVSHGLVHVGSHDLLELCTRRRGELDDGDLTATAPVQLGVESVVVPQVIDQAFPTPLAHRLDTELAIAPAALATRLRTVGPHAAA